MESNNSEKQNSRPIQFENAIYQLASIRKWKPDAMKVLGCEVEDQFVCFPMRDHTRKIISWTRRRGDNQKIKWTSATGETHEVKSMSTKNKSKGLFYSALGLPVEGEVLICEGEADTVAAISAGQGVVIGTPGSKLGRVGEMALPILLNGGRRVILVPHPDVAGRNWMDIVGVLLLNSQCEVYYIPPHIKYDLDDRLKYEPERTLEDLIKEAVPFIEKVSGLPEILVVNRPLRDISDDGLAAIKVANEKDVKLFYRAGALVRLGHDENNYPITVGISENAMRGILTRAADFMKCNTNGNMIHVDPPKSVIGDILTRSDVDFPPLLGISEVPIIHTDGTYLDKSGYDSVSKMYYYSVDNLKLTDNLGWPLEIPNDEKLSLSINTLRELICDFPFDTLASKSNALAAMILPFVRSLIDGPTPLAIIDKPQARTGASLFIELVSMIATGRNASMIVAPKDDENWTKKITTFLRGGNQFIMFDNVDSKLYSGQLSVGVTCTFWKDRVMGTHEEVNIPNRACWYVTGNNIRLGGDMPDRSYLIRMDANMAHPGQRDILGFRHPELLKFVKKNRDIVNIAMLNIIRYWISKGCPGPTRKIFLGGFEDWIKVIGGILELCGEQHFLENLEMIYEQSDDDTLQWTGFLEKWHLFFGSAMVGAALVAKKIEADEDFLELVPDRALNKKGVCDSRTLGRALMRNKNRVFPNNIRLLNPKSRNNALLWQVVKIKE